MPLTKASQFASNVLLTDGVGTTGSPGSYFGFGGTGASPASSGPRIQAGVGNPNGVVTSPIGSLWFESVTGFWYRNTTGGTVWALLASGVGGGPAVLYDSGSIAAPAAMLGATGLSQAYSRLRGFLFVKTDQAAVAFESLNLIVNSDVTANNYDRAFFNSSVGGGANNSPIMGNASAATADANLFFQTDFWVDNYTAPVKHVLNWQNCEGATKGSGVITLGFTRYDVAAPVTGLQWVGASAGNFIVNSRCVIIGE